MLYIISLAILTTIPLFVAQTTRTWAVKQAKMRASNDLREAQLICINP